MKEPIKPLNLQNRGKLQRITVYVDSTDGNFFNYYKDTFKPEFEKLAKEEIKENFSLESMDDHNPMNNPKHSKAETLAITAVLGFENYTCLQHNLLIEKGKFFQRENYPKNLLKELINIIENEHLTTDEYHTDQLMIFMALAEGKSSMVCGEVSLHSQTMFELLRIFIPDFEYSITPLGNDQHKANLIEITGIGYKRSE